MSVCGGLWLSALSVWLSAVVSVIVCRRRSLSVGAYGWLSLPFTGGCRIVWLCVVFCDSLQLTGILCLLVGSLCLDVCLFLIVCLPLHVCLGHLPALDPKKDLGRCNSEEHRTPIWSRACHRTLFGLVVRTPLVFSLASNRRRQRQIR